MNTRHWNKLNDWVRGNKEICLGNSRQFKIEDDSEDRFGELTRLHWFINIIVAEF